MKDQHASRCFASRHWVSTDIAVRTRRVGTEREWGDDGKVTMAQSEGQTFRLFSLYRVS